MKQPSPHTSNTPTMEGMHTNVQETGGDSINREAVYLALFLAAGWKEHTRQGKKGVAAAYERFLELPAVVVIAVGWIVGVALLGSIALVLYWTVRVLVQLVVGSV
jgi:hypothetical protein